MGFLEKRDHNFVDTISSVRVDEFPKRGMSRCETILKSKQWSCNLQRCGSTQPNDANSPAAGRRGDGNDGVVKVHSGILTSGTAEQEP